MSLPRPGGPAAAQTGERRRPPDGSVAQTGQQGVTMAPITPQASGFPQPAAYAPTKYGQGNGYGVAAAGGGGGSSLGMGSYSGSAGGGPVLGGYGGAPSAAGYGGAPSAAGYGGPAAAGVGYGGAPSGVDVGAGGAGGYGAQRAGPPGGEMDWNHWAPAGVNEHMLHMGGSLARNLLASNISLYEPGVWGVWHSLKYYFAVDNAYVLRKLKALLLPVAKHDWARRRAPPEFGANPAAAAGAAGAAAAAGDIRPGSIGGSGQSPPAGPAAPPAGPVAPPPPRYLRPCLDPNAPDLYLPLMAFITFVLTTGFVKGASGTFTPAALTEATSACVVTQLLEVLLFRLGLYLLGAPAAMLDLVAYTGYKYVALVTNMAAGIAFGWTGYYVAFAWTGLMAAYFILKTMADAVPAGGGSTREFMLLGLSGLQLLVIWWLGYTRELV
ncbi:unnamed protein product [Phaeothamnion confervicola]